jgi:tetratricopeptide (TPR) repeat protein
MLEKSLHAGNIIAAVCTAADVTFAGGVVTTIGAALSTVALFSKLGRADRKIAESMADQMQTYLENSSLTEDRKKIAAQMLGKYHPSKADLARGNMDAATIAANMRVHVKATATDPAYETEIALDNYADILAATLAPFLEPKNINQAMLQELLARSDESGQSNRLHDEGITEKAIIRLAQRIAGETDDLGQAWLTLQDAMDTAVKVQQEGRIKSNHGDFVDTVLARVAELAKEGEYSDASRAIDAALVEEEAAHARRKDRLLTSGVELARLDGNATHAAGLLLQQADLAAGGQADFEGLRDLWRIYYEVGRDKGVALDLSIAIEIAQLVLAHANTPDERGMVLNDLGIALQTLGERETGTQHLQEAVTAYENTLKECTRDRVPLQWATTQMNLGAVLRILGARETGTQHLQEAVTAYENALKENTRDRVPLQWAGTQMNLGNVLRILGERETGTQRLQEAVTAYENTLKECTRDRVPLQWATTQMNLGTALLTLGARETGTQRLQEAVTAYENALKENTRDRVPLEWAKTKYNLAILELAFFDKTGDAAHLERALGFAGKAKEVFEQAQAGQYMGMIEGIIARINVLRDGDGG